MPQALRLPKHADGADNGNPQIIQQTLLIFRSSAKKFSMSGARGKWGSSFLALEG
jgi:hypothetical protein